MSNVMYAFIKNGMVDSIGEDKEWGGDKVLLADIDLGKVNEGYNIDIAEDGTVSYSEGARFNETQKNKARQQVLEADLSTLLSMDVSITQLSGIGGKELGDLLLKHLMDGNPHKEQMIQRQVMEGLRSDIDLILTHLGLTSTVDTSQETQLNETVKTLLSKF